MKSKLFTRNFTLLVLGQVFSLIGNYTLKFALAMYVLEQTGSAEIFGMILAVSVVPTILLSPLGGVLADRLPRRTLMVVLDLLSGVAVLGTFWGLRQGNGIWSIAALQILLGVLGALESPTVQACVPQLHSGTNLLKANAVVNQAQALAALVTPFAGSLLYTAWGIRPVLAAVCVCFFCTALLECFLVLPGPGRQTGQRILQILREDLRQAVHFLVGEQPAVLTLLLLAALASFFASGCITVGLPFLVRSVLGLSAAWYGGAESTMGLAAILSSVVVGLQARRRKRIGLDRLLAVFGISLFPAAGVFLADVRPEPCYLVLVAAMGMEELVCGIFSIRGLCIIQQRTPQNMTGKVMAFVVSISMCAQPLGQWLYGVAFEGLPAGIVLGGTGLVVMAVALGSRGFLTQLDRT